MSEAKKIAEYEERLQISEAQRRKLHNLIQELRGNIRVFARVRPFLPSDGTEYENGSGNRIIVTNNETNSIRICRTNEENRLEDHTFSFDKIFGQSSSQESVFQEVSEFVQSALDGYNVCLFSYGQTGSGKVKISCLIKLSITS
jgi:kinesin family protein C1